MVKVILSVLIFILLVTNVYFLTKLVDLQKSISGLAEEYNSFQTRGDDLKLQLLKLSSLNAIFNKVKEQSQRSIIDFITNKSKDLQIPFVQYSEKEEKIEKSVSTRSTAMEGQKSKIYQFKVYQFMYNGVEINKLISLLIACEQGLPGIKVKMIDLVMKEKDKKLVERVTVEFIKVTSLDSIKN